MTTEKAISVMQAYLDGKKIEFKHKYETKWKVLGEPKWCFIDYNYRIKKENNETQTNTTTD